MSFINTVVSGFVTRDYYHTIYQINWAQGKNPNIYRLTHKGRKELRNKSLV